MTTKELIFTVAKTAKVKRKVAADVVRYFTTAVHQSLKKNDEIRIAGLGTFRVLERKERKGVHPRTREKINVPATKSPTFRAARALRDAVKAGDQEESVLDVRDEVQRLCREGDAVSAFHVAMKSLIHARRKFGPGDPQTAGAMVTVADAARYREKYLLAEDLYRKALAIMEIAYGPSHPDAVHCKTVLSNLLRDHG